jgi:predicted metal-dependent phosphoesterase TrpH
MKNFIRNKLVSVVRKDQDTLEIHGILDDDIYSLELDCSVSMSSMKILSIQGKWNRWTTPECPRAENVLKEAVGFIIEEGIEDKIHKIIGRKGCRHFANLLIECCFSAKQSVLIAKWEDAKKKDASLTFDDFNIADDLKTAFREVDGNIGEKTVFRNNTSRNLSKKKDVFTKDEGLLSNKIVIDLHVHTFPASPCSSAAVDALIEEAKQIGLTGICLTDHNYVWNPGKIEDLRQKHGFLVLRGNEITTTQGDVLVFGYYLDIKGIISLEELRKEVIKSKGIMISAHPFRGFLVVGTDQLGLTVEKGAQRHMFKFVDAVEVLNGKVTEKENSFALSVAQRLGLAVTGGSDAHEVHEVGRYATCFAHEIKNEEDLVSALKNSRVEPVKFREAMKER